jgi:hypothetical protein
MRDDEELNKLIRLRIEWEEIVQSLGLYSKKHAPKRSDPLKDAGFTQTEKEAWQGQEPNFKKQIVKPLQRKRRGHAVLAILFLALATPHIFMQAAGLPNGLLQHPKVHVPNGELTLPYVR